MTAGNEPLAQKIAFLLPTNECNLYCVACCTESFRRGDKAPELTLKEYQGLIKSLKAEGYRKFDISGGEPFLREDILEIMGAIKADKDSYLVLVTNGAILNLERSRVKAALELVDELRISIDSHLEETHDQRRGKKGAFHTALEAVALARENRGKTRGGTGGPILGINFIWSGDDPGALLGIHELALGLGVDHLEVLRYLGVNPNQAPLGSREGAALTLAPFFAVLEELAQRKLPESSKLKTVRVTLPALAYRGYSRWKARLDPEVFRWLKVQFEPLGGCSRHVQNLVVGASGALTACVAMLNCPDLIGGFYHGAAESLAGAGRKIKERLQRRDELLRNKEPCGSCVEYSICRGGCPVEAFTYWSTMDLAPPGCPMHEGARRQVETRGLVVE